MSEMKRSHQSEGTPAEVGDSDRRHAIATVAGAMAAAFGLASSHSTNSTGGIGFVGGARAQDVTTPIGAKWWPSRWGPEDQAGASNHISPEKILDALKLVRTGKVHEIGRVYEAAMPKFGERAFTLRRQSDGRPARQQPHHLA